MNDDSMFDRQYTEQGAEPGTILPSGEATVRPRMRAIVYDDVDIQEMEMDLDNLDAVSPQAIGDSRVWIDIQGQADGDFLRKIGTRYDLHRLALADVANLGQRTKLEDYETYGFCVLRMATESEEGFRWEQVSLFIGKHFVISFQEKPGDCFDGVRKRLRSGGRRIRQEDADYLGAMLIDAIVDGYFPLLEDLGERMEDLETRVFEHPTRDILTEIYHTKRELLGIRRCVWPLRDALRQALKGGMPIIRESTLPYVRDTVDHLMQVSDIIETYRELAASFIDVYLSSVSHRTNEVMRILTIFSTIFIPLTFIAGIYGMNFESMPELHWKHGYRFFWLLISGVMVGCLFLFWKLGWLGKVKGKDED